MCPSPQRALNSRAGQPRLSVVVGVLDRLLSRKALFDMSIVERGHASDAIGIVDVLGCVSTAPLQPGIQLNVVNFCVVVLYRIG